MSDDLDFDPLPEWSQKKIDVILAEMKSRSYFQNCGDPAPTRSPIGIHETDWSAARRHDRRFANAALEASNELHDYLYNISDWNQPGFYTSSNLTARVALEGFLTEIHATARAEIRRRKPFLDLFRWNMVHIASHYVIEPGGHASDFLPRVWEIYKAGRMPIGWSEPMRKWPAGEIIYI